MIEVALTTTTQLNSVEIQVAPHDRRRETPEKSRRDFQKSLEILLVSAVLSLQWVPTMPQ